MIRRSSLSWIMPTPTRSCAGFGAPLFRWSFGRLCNADRWMRMRLGSPLGLLRCERVSPSAAEGPWTAIAATQFPSGWLPACGCWRLPASVARRQRAATNSYFRSARSIGAGGEQGSEASWRRRCVKWRGG